MTKRSLLLAIAALALVVAHSLPLQEAPDSFEPVSRGRAGRKVHQLVAKEKKFDPEDEDYAVDKGEEHKETIAQVSIFLVRFTASCVLTVAFV